MTILSKPSFLQTIVRHNVKFSIFFFGFISIVLHIPLDNSICVTHINQNHFVIQVLYYTFLCGYYLEANASETIFNCNVNWQIALRGSFFEEND